MDKANLEEYSKSLVSIIEATKTNIDTLLNSLTSEIEEIRDENSWNDLEGIHLFLLGLNELHTGYLVGFANDETRHSVNALMNKTRDEIIDLSQRLHQEKSRLQDFGYTKKE